MVEVVSIVGLESAIVVGSLGDPYNIILLKKEGNAGSYSKKLGGFRAK